MRQRVFAGALLAIVAAACGGDGKVTEPTAATNLRPLAAIGTDPVTGATIETNQDDYLPGEIVHVNGRGWTANETVNLYMSEDPDTHEDVSMDVQADSSGAFSVHFYDVQQYDLGVTFTMTATGRTSGRKAVATFTDGRVINNFTLNGTSTVTVAASTSITASVSGQVNGNGQNTVGSIGLKAYLDGTSAATATVVACFNVNPDIGPSTPSNPVPFTQAFNFVGPVASGAYDVDVTIYGDDTCADNTGTATQTRDKGITVQSANTAPTLTGVPASPQTIPELALYTFDANASDSDIPPQTLAFSLVGAPAGAAIDPSTGVFTWTPTEAQGPNSYTFTVRVSDGTANTDNSLTLNVTEVNAAPALLNVPASATIAENAAYTFDANASDSDIPAQTLTFSLVGAPAGAAIDPSTGVFTWTPTEAQGPNSYTFSVGVSDGVVTTTQSVTLTVSESNSSPVLTGVPSSATIPEQSPYTFDANATDSDDPPQTLTFSLVNAPSGAAINAGTGVFTWTPTEAQGPGSYTFAVRVSDGIADTDQPITLTVSEINVAPVLTPIGATSVNELALLSFNATASDADEPANNLTFSLQGAVPSGAQITSGGAFTWTPTEVQGPGDFSVTIRVTDDGTGNLYDEETINIHVNEVNIAPVLNAIGAKNVDEGVLLTFGASASDADLPPNTLSFSLDAGAPTGANINASTGVFTWTPTEAQGPGTYSIIVRVTDNGTPAMSDYETISVVVKEVNVAPVLGAIGPRTIDEGSELTFTATATDADIPANSLTFSLATGAPAGASINSSTGQFTWTPPNGPTTASITVRVTDNGTPAMSDYETILVTVNNVAPHITTILGLPTSPIAVGTSVTTTWNFTDPGLETWTCNIKWDTNLSAVPATYVNPRSCSATQALSAGVYTVTVGVSDGTAADDSTKVEYIVVYDPNGGFVTGGGWIVSPMNAYAADPELTGKATFGFVSKYEKGATIPTGNTEFQFHAGSLNFKSTSYDWLVVAGTRAQYKGDGTVNGNPGYGFLLTAIDDATGDKFRIKIWNKATSAIVYDNQVGEAEDSGAATALSGGSIVIHTKK
jgi:hypothetical protein